MSIFDIYAAVSLKRCKIGSKLLLTTNRNMYTRFRLVPKSMTLDDLRTRFKVIDSLIRPPGTMSSGRAYVLPQMYLFFAKRSPRSLDRPETLPHRIWPYFIIPLQKFGLCSPPPPKKKNWGQKHAKFRSILDHFRI